MSDNNTFELDLDALSTTALQGSICSGNCYQPQDPEVQSSLREQRRLKFRKDDSPPYTRRRGLTVAESEQRMAGILQNFENAFQPPAR